MHIKDLPAFEKQNNLKINVHYYSKDKVQGIRYNNNRTVAPKTVNLLLVERGETSHFCAITSLSALYYKCNKGHSRFYCERCCEKFTVKHMLEKHYQFCVDGKAQVERMPKRNKYTNVWNDNLFQH